MTKKLVIGFLIGILVVIGLDVWVGMRQNVPAKQPTDIQVTQPSEIKSSPASKLPEVVAKSLEGTKGTYAVYIKHFKTGEEFWLRGDRIFEVGSLYKLWVMATVFDQIEKGKLSMDDKLSGNIADLNNFFGISEEEAELTTGTINTTVAGALEQMITISHNYAAMLLLQKVSAPTVRTLLSDNGFTVSNISNPPRSSADEIAQFLEKMYLLKLVSPQASFDMLAILKRQTFNEGLPKYLPENQVVAHKTGDIDQFKHDAGIVYTNKGDYLIVVLSQSDSPFGAQERIAQLSKNVFDYFNASVSR